MENKEINMINEHEETIFTNEELIGMAEKAELRLLLKGHKRNDADWDELFDETVNRIFVQEKKEKKLS